MDLSLRRFSIRQKLWTGGITVLLLLGLLGGSNVQSLLTLQTYMNNIVTNDEPTLRHTLQIKANLLSSTSHINLYLLDKDAHHRQMAFEDLAAALEHLNLLQELQREHHTQTPYSHADELKEKLTQIEVVYQKLLETTKSELDNIPALSFSSTQINPLVFDIIQRLNALAASELESESAQDKASLMKVITDLRYTWTRLAADMRAYIAFRTPQLMENVNLYLEGSEALSLQLQERMDEVPFEHQEFITDLLNQQTLIDQRMREMVSMHSAELWRRDMQITAQELTPLLHHIDKLIGESVTESVEHMLTEGDLALRHTDQATQTIVLLLPLLGLVGLALLFLIIRSISCPISEAVLAMDDIASGTGNLNRRMDEQGHDEVARLAQGFNAFVSKIKGVVDLVIVSSTSLAEESGRMHKTTDRSREQVADQQLHINEIGSLVDDMANAANQASDKARSAADSARESERHAQAGRETVSTVLTAMRQLADEVQQSTGSIEQVAENSRNIGGVLSVIRGFSEQTNLLALNAAIEAARAGENGRGFAVVADEVRSLAAKIHQETDSIERIISALQDNTRNAVELMQHSSEQTVLLVNRADQADEALTAITDSVTEIARTNDEITALTDTQQQHTDQVQQRVASLREIAGQSAESVNQAANSANEFTIMAGQLQDLVQQFLLDEKRTAKTKKAEDTAAATDAETAADADEDDVTLF